MMSHAMSHGVAGGEGDPLKIKDIGLQQGCDMKGPESHSAVALSL